MAPVSAERVDEKIYAGLHRVIGRGKTSFKDRLYAIFSRRLVSKYPPEKLGFLMSPELSTLCGTRNGVYDGTKMRTSMDIIRKEIVLIRV